MQYNNNKFFLLFGAICCGLLLLFIIRSVKGTKPKIPLNSNITIPSVSQNTIPSPTLIVIDAGKVFNRLQSGLNIGEIAPDFSLTTLDNTPFRLSDYKGKTVILFGVAGWCGECIPEGKALTQVKKDYTQKGVEIIGVAFTKGDNNDFLKQYKQIGGVDIPLALDTDNVAGKYHITRLETTYIINKEGKIAYKDERETSYDDYKKELDKIL